MSLIATAVLGAIGVMGAVGHSCAKETNEKAQKVSRDAQHLYENEKYQLEQTKKKTEEIILKLGETKRSVLDTSMKKFLNSYEKIKHIQFTETVGINEISKLMIDQQGVSDLRKMMDTYYESIESNDATAVVALATVGSLWASASGLSLMMGTLFKVGGPVALFTTALSSSIKADENLEKANAMYAEAEAATEKMKVSETLYGAIFDRTDMFHDLLVDLNEMFSVCSSLLVEMLKKKEVVTFKPKLTSQDFTEDELKLIAVTRALAGAVKSVIDTPILSKNGNVSYESENVYYQTVDKMHDLSLAVEGVEVNYGCENVNARKVKRKYRSVNCVAKLEREETNEDICNEIEEIMENTTRRIEELDRRISKYTGEHVVNTYSLKSDDIIQDDI